MSEYQYEKQNFNDELAYGQQSQIDQKSDYNDCIIMDDDMEEKGKKEPEIQIDHVQQFCYILPNYIKPYWEKAKNILQQIQKNGYLMFDDFLKDIQQLLSFHYSKKKQFNTKNLQTYLESLGQQEIQYILQELLPFMAQLALQIEQLFPNSINILIQNIPKQEPVVLTQKQSACLMFHLFFGTLHNQPSNLLSSETNLHELFGETQHEQVNKTKILKLKCFFCYFRQIQQMGFSVLDTTEIKLIFERVMLQDSNPQKSQKHWEKSEKPLMPIQVFQKGGIEQDQGAIQIIFANKQIGGGALGLSLLQEEIRWLTNPELYLQRLFYETLDTQEAAITHGAAQYSTLTGYGQQCRFEKEIFDRSPINVYDYKDVTISSIDAECYGSKKDQFKMNEIMREIRKAYTGFALSEYISDDDKNGRRAVATGKWGCGAFNGDTQLKFIIQWIAASECERDMHFYTYNDPDLKLANIIVETLKPFKVTQVMKILTLFLNDNIDTTLFQYIQDFIF